MWLSCSYRVGFGVLREARYLCSEMYGFGFGGKRTYLRKSKIVQENLNQIREKGSWESIQG